MSETTPLTSSGRTSINTEDPGRIRIMYRAPISEKMRTFLAFWGMFDPMSGIFCARDRLYRNSYVQIHENRVEVNMPSLFQYCLCFENLCQINDYVRVYYFDKRLGQQADRATCCSPICCPIGTNPLCGGYFPHSSIFGFFPCCPTLFDTCGQGVVLHGKLPILCCHQFAFIPFLEDAQEFVDNFNRIRAAHFAADSTVKVDQAPAASYGATAKADEDDAPVQQTMA